MKMVGEEERHTCLKVQVKEEEDKETNSIFVKGSWFSCHFDLYITDGLHSWICNASEEDVRERASQWDQSVSEYIEFAENYLGFQQPASVYRFADVGNGHRRLSWTFEKQGVKLEWRWRCKPSPNNQITTASILDFLLQQTYQLSEVIVRKDVLLDNMKQQVEKSSAQNEKLCADKQHFESQLYEKFVSVLNSKKLKLRELRDQLSKQQAKGKLQQQQQQDVSTDETDPFFQTETETESESEAETEDGANSD